jgi:hypothetical protein
MNRLRMPERQRIEGKKMLLDKKAVTLRTVADSVGLAPCSVSAVLNNTPASWAIPQRTKDRVLRAAAELNYRPNLSARSLRTKRTHMVAVVSPDFGNASVARVMASMERLLRRRGYLLVLAAFDGAAEASRVGFELQQRGIEGVIAMGATLPREIDLPVASVDLGYLTREPLVEAVGDWLKELGESAVEAVLSMIEAKAAPRKTRENIVPKFPPAFADLGFERSRFDLSGAGLGLSEEIRDAS